MDLVHAEPDRSRCQRKARSLRVYQAAMEAYDFFWKEFCAYYLEIVKPVLFGKAGSAAERKNKQKILVIVLCQAVRLIHPMAPFITEELFQLLKERLKGVKARSGTDPYTAESIAALHAVACIVAPYPQVIREGDINPAIDQTFDLVGRVVYAIRNIRGEMKLPPGTVTDVHIVGQHSDPQYRIVDENRAIIKALVRTNQIDMHPNEPKVGFACTGVVDTLKIMIPLPAEMLKQEKLRLLKEKDKLTVALGRCVLPWAIPTSSARPHPPLSRSSSSSPPRPRKSSPKSRRS